MVLHAKDCNVVVLSKKIYEHFVSDERIYIEHYNNISVVYGIYHNGELIQFMSFGKPRFDNKYSWEILDHQNMIDKQIIGGVDKIWKHFINNEKVSSCIYYSCEENKINENTLFDIGFVNKPNSDKSNNVYSYFPFGILYKVTDLNTGQFYIGKCESKANWEAGYMGSGRKWVNHMNSHSDHNYKREILNDCFYSPNDLHKAEEKEIRKYCEEIEGKWKILNKSCLNIIAHAQGVLQPCVECGGVAGHKSYCSKYKKPKTCQYCGSPTAHKNCCPKKKKTVICKECNGKGGRHYKHCSNFNRNKCEYCGSTSAHKKDCPKYNKGKICEYCGSPTSHKKNCQFSNKKDITCEYCGSHGSRHKIFCIKNKNVIKVNYVCVECREINGKHKKYCSHWKPVVCLECGGIGGLHRSGCSKEKKCLECGYSLTSHKHAKTCSQYKKPNRNKQAKILA